MEAMKEELERLKKERTQLRRLFSVAAKKVQDAINNGATLEDSKEEYALFADKASRLFKVEEKVNDLLLTTSLCGSDEDLSKEYDAAESYRDTFTRLGARFEQLTKGEDDATAVSRCSGANHSHNNKLKLPKLIPVAFDGQLKHWITFWSIFKRIDESNEYDDGEKFQYLLMYMAKESPARELVESFPPLAENYSKALESLKARFGREDLLIEFYVRELLALVLLRANGEANTPLHKLYDQLVTQIHALESLGVTRDKYTYLLTPLVESALPDEVLRDWNRECKARLLLQPADKEDGFEGLAVKMEKLGVTNFKAKEDKMQLLLDFLKREVESEEGLILKRSALGEAGGGSKPVPNRDSTMKGKGQLRGKKPNTPRVETAAGLVNVRSTPDCVFCSGPNHVSADCVKAREKSRDELEQVLKTKGLCFRCVRGGHNSQKCKVFLKCIICSGRHVPLMCKDRKMPTSAASKSQSGESKVEQNLHNACRNSVLMQTVRVRIKGVPNLTARVLFDSGSQRSYVTKQLVEKMQLTPTGELKVEHALFGGTVSKPKSHKCYKIRLEDMESQYSCNFDVLDSDTICVAVPSIPISNLQADLEQCKIKLTDTQDGPIDILIGADVSGKLMTGRKIDMENGLVAFQTLLGWTLIGKIPLAEPRFMSHINLFIADLSVQDLWRLETIGIEDSAQVRSREEKVVAAKEHFLETVKVLESGRYEVQLPWSDDHPPLPRNFDLALKRFESTFRRLKATSNVDRYFSVFQDWLSAGIIEEIFSEDWDKGHYLPHRPVFKEGSTTPIRPVFDASARVKGHPSLNQCLEVGPNLVELIPSVLLRFRLGQIGIIADIKRAFLQISLSAGDRDFLRFLWRGEDGKLRIFRHTRVVFGVCSSPFLLGAVVDYHLNRCRQMLVPTEVQHLVPQKHGLSLDEIIDQLRRCMYVDNFVGSLNDPEEIHGFISSATSLFALACFELRGWVYSNPALDNHTNTQVLGLLWDEKGDTLKLNVPSLKDIDPNRVTKKDLMSANHRLYDPIGFTSPVLVTPKKLIQDTWRTGGNWDDPIDESSQSEFNHWSKEIYLLGEILIPRWVCGTNAEGVKYSLHTFCDASQLAYATAIFLRTEWQDNVNVRLVAAKTRIAPVQKVTIPRLELLAATVGARLAHHVLQILPEVRSVHYWSDSSTTLAWIKRDHPWAIFVRNRVQEIRRLSDPGSWAHVPGTLNPADLASRGCSPRALVASKWWEGPTWLRLPEGEWPQSSVECDENEVYGESLKGAHVSHSEIPFSRRVLTDRISQYWKILKVIGWIVRFRNNARKNVAKTRGRLTLDEIQAAERWIIRLAQRESFSEGMVEIRKLKPQTTADGLLRVRTKIWARKDSEDFRAPIILPSNHKLVEKLIFHVHCRNGHIVGQHLLNFLREHFWVVKGRRTVRRIVGNCKICKRFTAKNLQVESPALPEERVRDAYVFEVTGTDYAGPLYLADGTKVWVCLFTCAIYRAIHLELVTSLSTECFMLAFRRFVARRGRPAVIYSDNGTNYRGMKNSLDTIDWDKVVDFGNIHKIEWRFNPPSAPWWGGFWERMVRSLKNLLRKIIGRASLTFEELNTVMCDCEAQINSRPITYISEDPEDPIPITPQMFLQEIRQIGVPDCDQIDSKTLNRRIKHRQTVQEELRQRFRAEYLGQLTLSSTFGNTREPKVGEIVMIGSDSQKRLHWPLGVVEEIIHGRDGRIRVVHLRTAEGKLSRPIQRIFPLELTCTPEEELPSENEDAEPDDVTLGDETGAEQRTSIDDTVPLRDSATDLFKTDDAKSSPMKTCDKVKGVCEGTTRCGRQVKLPIRFK